MLRVMERQEFDAVFSIMKESFPVDEYRPYEEQRALLDRAAYCVYLWEHTENPKDETIKAFISVWQFEDFAYIEHFAVNPIYRNQGYGAFILREIKKLLSCPICLEVELPETDMAKRRIVFYERNGFFLNEYDYIQPPMSKGKNPVPLLVMTSGGKVSAKRFDEIKKCLYREVYKKK